MPFCNDYGDAPDCRGKADPEFTMDFTDVEKDAYIHWCSVCGPKAKALSVIVNAAFKEHGSEFTERLKKELDLVEKERVTQ